MYKTANSARDEHIFSFPHLANHFLTIFNKVHEFVQKSVFRPRSARFLILGKWVHYFLVIFSKVYTSLYIEKNSDLSARSARFVIFALGAPLFSGFQESGRVCTEQKFSARDQHVFSFFQRFSAKCTILNKTAISARDQHVLSFSRWAHHCLAIFSKGHEFMQNSLFSPTSARFVIFALSAPPFRIFSKVHDFV